MPNILRPTAENAAELLNAGAYGVGARIRIQSAVAEAGPFADITGTGSTPTVALVAGTRSYTGFDPNGVLATWYRTRFESLDGTRLSDWTDPFQIGAEGAGGICSLYDVKQRLNIDESDITSDEILLEFIGHVTDDVQGITGRRFVRTPAVGTEVMLFDVGVSSRKFRIAKGIAACTQLEVATQSQPEAAGVYTIVPAADWFLRPVEAERDHGWPATQIVITDRPTGGVAHFSAGYNAVRATIALGWVAVPGDIRAIGEGAVVRRWKAKQSGQADIVGSSEFGARTLRFISPEERDTLTRYSVRPI
jgi:hypothetical protein